MNFRSIVAALLAVALGSQSAEAAEAEPLPALCIDENAISVSGISSGAYFAHQFHVAHSRRVMGAGIFAGGPYLCAGENFPQNLFRSLNVCSNTGTGSFRGPPEPQRSISAARIAAAAGGIDDVSGLRGDRVFLFSGRLDTLVPTSVLDAVQSFYRAFDNAKDIAFVSDVDAAHAMVTDTFGNACDTSESPHLNACGYDLAGATLAHIYGPLEPPRTAEGELLAFDSDGVRRRPATPRPRADRLCVRAGGLRARRRLPAARRLPRLPAEHRYDRRRLHPPRRLQRVGRGQPTSSSSIRRRRRSPTGSRACPWTGRTRKAAGTGGASPAQTSRARPGRRSAPSMR